MKTDTITYLNDAIDIVVKSLQFNYKNIENKGIQKFVPHFSGRVGCGKSQGIQQAKNILADWMVDQKKIKDASEYQLIYLDAPQMDYTDVNGWFVPSKDGQTMNRLRPPHCPTDGYGIIFIDEFTQASQSVQSVLAQLILERRLGEHKLGDGWQLCVASNRIKDRASTSVMPTQVRDRLKPWLNVDNTWESIANHFMDKGINQKIVSWVKYTKDQFTSEQAFDRDANSNPTPRSIEVAGSVLDMELDEHLLRPMLCGTIGNEASTSLLAFIKYYDRLPNLKEIVKAPLQAPMVEQGQLAFVLTCELVKVVKHKREAFDSCVQYIERMYKEHNSAELVALFIKDCLSNDGTLKTHAKTRELFGSNSPFAHLLN